jgi:hypothetical protein
VGVLTLHISDRASRAVSAVESLDAFHLTDRHVRDIPGRLRNQAVVKHLVGVSTNCFSFPLQVRLESGWWDRRSKPGLGWH